MGLREELVENSYTELVIGAVRSHWHVFHQLFFSHSNECASFIIKNRKLLEFAFYPLYYVKI